MSAVWGSLSAALAACVVMGVATIMQAVAARRGSGMEVLRSPLYLGGVVLDMVAWGLSLLAMQHLPLLAVQTILAASLALSVTLAVPVLKVRPGRTVWIAVVVVCLACGVVAASAEPGPPEANPAWLVPAMAVALVALVASAVPVHRVPRTAPRAVVAALGYSGTAVAARALHGSSVLSLLADPLVWLIIGFGLVGAVMFARALETKPDAVNEAKAWLWVVEVVASSIVGLTVLGDRLRPGWELPALAGAVAALAATVVISRSSSVTQLA